MYAKLIISTLIFTSAVANEYSAFCDQAFVSIFCDLLGLNADPVTWMKSPEIVAYYGYPIEIHTITTDDGYIIDMHRIPYGKNGSGTQKRQPLLILHGLFCDSFSWLWNLPDRNIPFVFADAGYDVWLGNYRGNTYGRRHVNLTTEDAKFWQFSMDEIAKYDLPKMIDTMLATTNFSQIFFIGHSVGTTVMFALLSSQIDYNEKVKVFASLAPAVYTRNLSATSNVFRQLSNVLSSSRATTHDEFNPNDGLGQIIFTQFCGISVVKGLICGNLLEAVFGWDQEQQNDSRVDIYLNKYPGSTSYYTFLQQLQMVQGGGDLNYYDYGPVVNQQKYGQTSVPKYNITNITTRVALMWAANDLYATPENVALLPDQLQNAVWFYRVKWDKFTHWDFQTAIDLNTLVTYPLMEMFAKYL